MSNFLNKLKLICQKIRYMFPSAVPTGMSEFETWAQSIVDTYRFPDNDSVRFALASMIMHSGETAAYVPKFTFALKVRAAMAKQIAGAQFHNLKQKQAAATAPTVADGQAQG